LKSIPEEAFESLTLLKKIDLSRNSLTFIPRNTFRNLTSLAVIDLRENFIEGEFDLPKSLYKLDLRSNLLSVGGLKLIVKGLNRLQFLTTERNERIGPVLTSDVFASLDETLHLSMDDCKLKTIESGTFQAMRNLSLLDLSHNMLSHIQPGAIEGPGEHLGTLSLYDNNLMAIADGTFRRFHFLSHIRLEENLLTSVPDLTGLTVVSTLDLSKNRITDISRLGKSGNIQFLDLRLTDNQIDHIPAYVFQNISVRGWLDLSFNKIHSIPENVFIGCQGLALLGLNFNNITHFSRQTFAGLKNLRTLMIIKNKLKFIPKDAFAEIPLQTL